MLVSAVKYNDRETAIDYNGLGAFELCTLSKAEGSEGGLIVRQSGGWPSRYVDPCFQFFSVANDEKRLIVGSSTLLFFRRRGDKVRVCLGQSPYNWASVPCEQFSQFRKEFKEALEECLKHIKVPFSMVGGLK